MSFQAKMRLDEDYGNELTVLAAEYEFSQSMDSQNLPNGRPNAGIVYVTIPSGRDNKIVEWMVSPKMTKFVQILFKGKDGSTIKLLELTNTYCVNYRETFNANDADPMKMMLKLSAWDIRINITYGKTNDWAEFQSSRSAANIADSSTTPPGVGAASSEPTVTYQNDVATPPAVADVPDTPAVPDTPTVPDTPAMPDVPKIPDTPQVPDIPSAPEVPQVPDIPSVPNIPTPPDMPSIPDPPSVPQVPDMPSVPDIPSPPPLPNVPSAPDIPEPPTVPSFIP